MLHWSSALSYSRRATRRQKSLELKKPVISDLFCADQNRRTHITRLYPTPVVLKNFKSPSCYRAGIHHAKLVAVHQANKCPIPPKKKVKAAPRDTTRQQHKSVDKGVEEWPATIDVDPQDSASNIPEPAPDPLMATALSWSRMRNGTWQLPQLWWKPASHNAPTPWKLLTGSRTSENWRPGTKHLHTEEVENVPPSGGWCELSNTFYGGTPFLGPTGSRR